MLLCYAHSIACCQGGLACLPCAGTQYERKRERERDRASETRVRVASYVCDSTVCFFRCSMSLSLSRSITPQHDTHRRHRCCRRGLPLVLVCNGRYERVSEWVSMCLSVRLFDNKSLIRHGARSCCHPLVVFLLLLPLPLPPRYFNRILILYTYTFVTSTHTHMSSRALCAPVIHPSIRITKRETTSEVLCERCANNAREVQTVN